jgi:hypothetical protein
MSKFSWPWHQLEVSGQLHAPANLRWGKSPWYPLDRKFGWPQSQFGWRGENSWPYWDLNSKPSVIQPIASHYTNCAILAPCYFQQYVWKTANQLLSTCHDYFNSALDSAMDLPVTCVAALLRKIKTQKEICSQSALTNTSKPQAMEYLHFSLADNYFKCYNIALNLYNLEWKSMLLTYFP